MVIKLKEQAHWEWFEALYFWDYGETSLLANLIVNATVPANLKPLMMDIVSAVMLPRKKKAAAKIIQKQMNTSLGLSKPKKEKSGLIAFQKRLEILTKLYDDLNYLEDIEANQIEDLVKKHRVMPSEIRERLKQDKQDAF